MLIEMRPALQTDSDLLFEWRNDAETRALSHNTALVEHHDHERWMQFNVLNGYPAHVVMIADSELGALGVIRFDVLKTDVMSYIVSIAIAPRFRGQGYGGQSLAEACRLMGEYTLIAEIRPENAGSIRIFERCGFKRVRRNKANGMLTYKRGPL